MYLRFEAGLECTIQHVCSYLWHKHTDLNFLVIIFIVRAAYLRHSYTQMVNNIKCFCCG